MVYQFVYPCSIKITEQIAAVAGANSYFLICIGKMNYFYSNDKTAIAKVRAIDALIGTMFYTINKAHLHEVLSGNQLKAFQTFFGNLSLLEDFIRRSI